MVIPSSDVGNGVKRLALLCLILFGCYFLLYVSRGIESSEVLVFLSCILHANS